MTADDRPVRKRELHRENIKVTEDMVEVGASAIHGPGVLWDDYGFMPFEIVADVCRAARRRGLEPKPKLTGHER